jgi:phosphatidylglycerol lysyltransferase
MVSLKWERLVPWIGAMLFGVSALVLGHEVREVGFPAFVESLQAIPHAVVVQVVLLTALNYIVLTWHDRLAFQYAGVRLARARIGLASFVGYAISNNVGFAMMSGTSARCRFYTRWGLTAADISRVVLFYSTTFWLGLCLLGGAGLLYAPRKVCRRSCRDSSHACSARLLFSSSPATWCCVS